MDKFDVMLFKSNVRELLNGESRNDMVLFFGCLMFILGWVCYFQFGSHCIEYGCSYTFMGTNETIYGDCKELEKVAKRNDINNLDVTTYILPTSRDELLDAGRLFDNSERSDIIATTVPSTTLPLCPKIECPVCEQRDCVCTCPECTKCPSCDFELDSEQVKWLLNHHAIDGVPSYQAGWSDCNDEVLDYLKVPGRPKFASRPSSKAYDWIYGNKPLDDTYCFKNLGGYFILERTPDEYNRSRWGWNDDNCKSSSMRVNEL